MKNVMSVCSSVFVFRAQYSQNVYTLDLQSYVFVYTISPQFDRTKLIEKDDRDTELKELKVTKVDISTPLTLDNLSIKLLYYILQCSLTPIVSIFMCLIPCTYWISPLFKTHILYPFNIRFHSGLSLWSQNLEFEWVNLKQDFNFFSVIFQLFSNFSYIS